MTANKLHFLEDRWDEAVASKLDAPELASLSLQSPWLRSSPDQLRRRQHQFQDRRDRPARWPAEKSSMGQGLRRRSRQHQAFRLSPRSISIRSSRWPTATKASPARRRNRCDVSALHLRQQSCRCFHRYTPLHGFLPFPHVDHLHPDWGIALAASANGLAEDGAIQQAVWPQNSLGSVAAPRLRARDDACATQSPPSPVVTALSSAVTASSLGARHAAGKLPQHHHHHRPDRTVPRRTHAAANGNAAFGGAISTQAHVDRASLADETNARTSAVAFHGQSFEYDRHLH